MAAVNLLLIGRKGNGKSSTGNSILGRKEFTPRGVSSSVSYEIKKGVATIEGRTVTVVDGPGIGDSSTDVTDDGQSIIELVQKALSLTSNIFQAMLVVLKYGVRFTKQERDAVKMIKTIFGEDVIRNYGIIVMTYGDSFDLDMEDENSTFETWCSEQTGEVQSLFNECEKRCVLFDNRSKDPSKMKKQYEQLMKMVAEITTNRQPYGEDDFRKAEQSRSKLIVMSKFPELESKTEMTLNSITKQLSQIGVEGFQDHAKNIEELEEIFSEIQKFVLFLEEEDQNTGSISHLLTRISITKTKIKTMIDYQRLKMKNAENKTKQPSYTFPALLWRFYKSIRSDPWSYRSITAYLLTLSLTVTGMYVLYNYKFLRKIN